MVVKFWGVRGSVPTPVSPSRLKSKISAIVQRITPDDLTGPESRVRFLAGLPEDLFGTAGGNTTCLQVKTSKGDNIIFDAGTGLRELGLHLKKTSSEAGRYHIFFTHFHWDHLQGLPFFTPAYNPGSRITFYSPVKGFERIIKGQMKDPYFPVTMDVMSSVINFVELDRPVQIGPARVEYLGVNHPGGCYSYKVSDSGKSVIFSTDTELKEESFEKTDENMGFYQNTDIMVVDSQYTLGEAIERYNWGHTSYSMAVDFALEFFIKRLVLFHHDPTYDDKKLESIQRSAKWYLHHIGQGNLDIMLAKEGLELTL